MLREWRDKLKNFIFRRRYAYVQTFNGPLAEEVLADLMQFCRANETTFHEDARVSGLLEGRREVWLRIQQHLNLSPEELFTLATGSNASNQQVMVQSDDEE